MNMIRKSIFAVLSLSCGFSVGTARAQNTGNASDIASIQQLQQRYVASIDEADLVLVDQVWSHSPEVIFVEP
jgi:hypothetical protein